MAGKRMINGHVWEDQFFLNLSIFERLLWIGILTACADDQGRLQDHPALIRSRVFPVDDIGLQEIETGLARFAAAGKIKRYEKGGNLVIQIVNWWKHQKPRWAGASAFPAPDGWVDRERYHTEGNIIHTSAGWGTDGGYIVDSIDDSIDEPTDGSHRREVKVKDDDEVKVKGDDDDDAAVAVVFQSYEQEIGAITPAIADELKTAISEFPREWILESFGIAAKNNVRKWKYAHAILKDWQTGGKTDQKGRDSPAGGGSGRKNGRGKGAVDTSELDEIIKAAYGDEI
jgi:DnaD/phage-associated family protein